METGGSPFLVVGFNRRFAPLTGKLIQFFGNRNEPMMVHVRINAGFIPRDHWTQKEGDGGRIVGEFCHFVDWARRLLWVPESKLSRPQRFPMSTGTTSTTSPSPSPSRTVRSPTSFTSQTVMVPYPRNILKSSAKGRWRDWMTSKSCNFRRAARAKISRGKLDKGHRREIDLTVEAVRRRIPFADSI